MAAPAGGQHARPPVPSLNKCAERCGALGDAPAGRTGMLPEFWGVPAASRGRRSAGYGGLPTPPAGIGSAAEPRSSHERASATLAPHPGWGMEHPLHRGGRWAGGRGGRNGQNFQTFFPSPRGRTGALRAKSNPVRIAARAAAPRSSRGFEAELGIKRICLKSQPRVSITRETA